MSRLATYLAPLKELYPALREHGCELHLGLMHAGDLEWMKVGITEAQKVAPEFGVATECRLGRTPAKEFEGIMEDMVGVSRPVAM